MRYRYVVDTNTGCQRWQGQHNSAGYGVTSGKPRRMAHRAVWEIKRGAIPPGMVLDHVWLRGCRHRDCINIDHLELVTPAVNSHRASSSHKINGDLRREYVKMILSRVGLQ